jgi:hypothetical protein
MIWITGMMNSKNLAIGVDEHVVTQRIEKAYRALHTGIFVDELVYLAQRDEDFGIVKSVQILDNDEIVFG